MRRNLRLVSTSIILAVISVLSASAQEPAPVQPYQRSASSNQVMTGKQWRIQQAMIQRQMLLNYYTWYGYSPARPTINANPYFQVPPSRQIYVIAPYGQSYQYYQTSLRGF